MTPAQKLLRSNYMLGMILLSAIIATGCAKKQKADEIAPGTDMGDMSLGDSDSGRAMGLVTIRFPYDSSTLDGEAKEGLKNNASILKDKTSIAVQIEGHCDSRGGVRGNGGGGGRLGGGYDQRGGGTHADAAREEVGGFHVSFLRFYGANAAVSAHALRASYGNDAGCGLAAGL